MTRLLLLLAATTAVLIAACDTAPQIIALGANGPGNTTLRIAPSTAQINVGGLLQLSTNAPIDSQTVLEWSSFDPTIAAVTPAGVVQGIAAGTTTIKVRYSSDTTIFGTAVIKVNQVPGTGTRIP